MLAVGPSRSLIADDDLLNWLHDPDAEVRRLTESGPAKPRACGRKMSAWAGC